MSTTVAHPGITPGSGPSRRLLGVAAAGLTVVIAIGFVVAVTQGDDVAPGRPRPIISNVQPNHPMVSDAHRAKAQILAERRAEAAAQANANRFNIIGGASTQVPEAAQSLLSGRDTFPVFGGASTQVPEVAQSPTSTADAWQAQYQNYIDFLTDRAPSQQAKKAMWEQHYDDLVERFQNQYNAGRVIEDTLIGYK